MQCLERNVGPEGERAHENTTHDKGYISIYKILL